MKSLAGCPHYDACESAFEEICSGVVWNRPAPACSHVHRACLDCPRKGLSRTDSRLVAISPDLNTVRSALSDMCLSPRLKGKPVRICEAIKRLLKTEPHRRTRAIRRRHHAPASQLLEERLLLTNLASVESVADQLRPFIQQLEGITVVTHGFQAGNGDGDGMSSLSHAIRERADSFAGDYDAWLLDYDLRDDGGEAGIDVDLNAEDDGLNNGSIMSGFNPEVPHE